MKKTLCAIALLLSLTGLGCKNQHPNVSKGKQFTLAIGDAVYYPPADSTIYFLAVDNDSRCASDVVCIRAGEATVRVQVAQDTGEGNSYLLSVGADVSQPMRVRLDEEFLRLTALDPYPQAAMPTSPNAYRATFIIE